MANAEQAERNNYGSFECIYCGREFTADNPCWNDDAVYEDGSHRDGECKECAAKGMRDSELRVMQDFVNYRGE